MASRLLVIALLLAGGAQAEDRRYERMAQLAKHDGEEVTVIGTYQQIDVRQKQAPPPVYGGHVALRLADGEVLYLGRPFGAASLREQGERDDLDGERVVARGRFQARCPEEPGD